MSDINTNKYSYRGVNRLDQPSTYGAFFDKISGAPIRQTNFSLVKDHGDLHRKAYVANLTLKYLNRFQTHNLSPEGEEKKRGYIGYRKRL
jgi:hypothetical protein